MHKLLKSGLDHHQNGKLTQADAIYKAYLKQFPDDPEGLHLAALLALHQNRPLLAVQGYRKAVALDPENTKYLKNLGAAATKLGDWPIAIESYEKVTQIEASDPEGWHGLYVSLVKAGRDQEAFVSVSKALEILPESPALLIDLGTSERQRGNLDHATAHFAKALGLDTKNEEARWNLAYCLNEQGDTVQAAETIKGLKPKKVTSLWIAGRIALANNHHDKAFAILDKARDHATGELLANIEQDLERCSPSQRH